MSVQTKEQTETVQAEAMGGVAARRPWWAKIPGLGIFVPPVVEPVVDVLGDSDGGVGEVLPLNARGAVLRQSARSARAGWYAPALPGAPSTTRQAEILNLALIAPPTGTEGVVLGRDRLSRALIAHDAATAYNATPREVTSTNVLCFGGVGGGKSSFCKTVAVARPLVLRRRNVVVFDKKPNDDDGTEGEYAPLARRFGVEPIRFTQDGSGTRLNIMDPDIAAATGVSGQYDLLTAIARVARDDAPLNEWEKKALRVALRNTFKEAEGGRTPVPADLLPMLGRAVDDPELADLRPHARDLMHEAGLSLRWTFDELLTAYPGLLDGETSAEVDLAHKLTVFDLSQLADAGPAVPVVMAIGNMMVMGRLRRARGAERRVTNVIYEEGWHMIGGPSAALVKSNEKLSRALGLENWFVMHKGTDIPEDSPGIAVIQESQTVYAFRQDRQKDAEWTQRMFNLEPPTTGTLMQLPVGECVMKVASRPEIQLQHVRSRWEVEFTNTDAALAVVARG